MLQDNLLTREGPLAQVWLAANLERKLNKTQFLQSNITQSTQAIVQATQHSNETTEALTLRLSGQLLYGVVRIYSRKAKYLLDDVSDALLKLKSAFKSSANTVTLPVNATIIPSMKQIVLQDTVTQSDLLYQEPLTFDDDPQRTRTFDFFGTQSQNSMDVDESIELPRNKFGDDIDVLEQDDGLDIDLNFDLDQDQDHDQSREFPVDDFGDEYRGNEDVDFGDFDLSVETGRASDEQNLSAVADGSIADIALDKLAQIPLETLDEIAEEQQQTQGQQQTQEQQQQQQPKKRKQRQQTLGRKIVTDSEIELNIRAFNNTQGITTNDNEQGEEQDKELDLNSKRLLVEAMLNKNYLQDDIAEQFFAIKNNKRQKTQPSSPINDELPGLQSDRENESMSEQQEEFFFNDDVDFGDDGPQDDMEPLSEDLGMDLEQEDEDPSLDYNSGVTESTVKIEQHVTDLLKDNGRTTFTEVIEKDVQSSEPLSHGPKSEATRVFFELLVLATSDKIKVKQDELFGQIAISV